MKDWIEKLKKNKFLQSIGKGGGYKALFVFICFASLLFLIIVQKMETKKINVGVGDRAPVEIRANRDIVDERTTKRLEEEAVDKVEAIYRLSPSVQVTIKSNIRDFFDEVKDLQSLEDMTVSKKAEMLAEESRIHLSKNEYNIALSFDEGKMDSFASNINDLITQIMGAGIKEEDLEYEKENIEKIFETIDMKEKEKQLGIAILVNTIQPNEFVDVEATEKKKDEAIGKIDPIVVKEHQVIVNKGDIIDKDSLELIKESGLLKDRDGYDKLMILGVVIMVILLSLIIFGYLYLFNNDVIYGNKLLVLFIIILFVILISQGMYNISPYIIPISTATLLIALLIDIRLALIVNVLLVYILSFTLKLENTMVGMYLISGSIGAFVVSRQQRYNILLNGLLIGIGNVLTIVAFALIKKVELMDVFIRSGYGLANGLFCGVLTIGTLPIWENVFKILTPLKLLELSNPNQYLLKRLLLEAPGTYHHSIIVGNLSERAAESIGADPLISRVGAYYHDIGKLNRPYFFKENQIGMDNPHDKLNPNMSTLILTNHVKEGVSLGKKHKLPKEIIDIIEQHHGNTVVMFFYHKAKQEERQEVKIEDFRYKGPKPQTREAAIVMLADSTEAAVRSIKEPNKNKIEEMIRNIIEGKLKDGQLEESNLTLKDLNTIGKAFSSIIMGIFHERIEYPDLDSIDDGRVESEDIH